MSDAHGRVLVVDDQAEIRDVTATVLGNAGYAVEALGSGNEALRRLGESTFDLILLDIDMPGMNGWETLRLIRADQRLTALPVVMFSVNCEIQDKLHGLQEGAVDYITKPFIVDDLLSQVERLLETQGGDGTERGGVPSPG